MAHDVRKSEWNEEYRSARVSFFVEQMRAAVLINWFLLWNENRQKIRGLLVKFRFLGTHWISSCNRLETKLYRIPWKVTHYITQQWK